MVVGGCEVTVDTGVGCEFTVVTVGGTVGSWALLVGERPIGREPHPITTAVATVNANQRAAFERYIFIPISSSPIALF